MNECTFCNFELRDPDMFDEETDSVKTIGSKSKITIKGCESPLIESLEFAKLTEDRFEIRAMHSFSEYCSIGIPLRIKYCPMCGRKL